MLGKIEGRTRGDDRGWDGWMASPTQWHEFEQTPGDGEGQRSLTCCSQWGTKSQIRLSDWATTTTMKHSPDQTRCDKDKTWNHRILKRPANICIISGWERTCSIPTGWLPGSPGSQLRGGASSPGPSPGTQSILCHASLPWVCMKGKQLDHPSPWPRGGRATVPIWSGSLFKFKFFWPTAPREPRRGKRSCISKALVMCYDSFSCFKQMFTFVSNSAFTFLYSFS